ncbi:MAG: hypothetical protein J5I81_06735 [Nitrococcus mobilis]|nr:hypothetical protein [Nitrococcus mobilis]
MLDTGQVVVFLGGLGVGSILTAVVQHWLARRGKKDDTRFTERKTAFDGLLASYAALAEGWSDQKAKQFALWEAKVQLVASPATVDALKRLKASDPGTSARTKAHDDLMAAMRVDLKVAE